nr:forkhead domain-containing protein [Colletotrichum truncatum]KAF6783307.1 forkhead domain-containing protein [Colletotrichum truncatum]
MPDFHVARGTNQFDSMDPTRASLATTFPQKAQHVLAHHQNADAYQRVSPHHMPAQTCLPYLSFGQEPVSPQPAEAVDQSSATTNIKVDESVRKMTYAELIHMAFLSRKTTKMELRELYEWFERNTTKANTDNKGWKNSVRSNLSLNQAFQRLDGKGSCWRLIETGLAGVQPTRKPRTPRRKKETNVCTAESNSTAPPTSNPSNPCVVPQEDISEVHNDHHSPQSNGDFTIPGGSRVADDPFSNYPVPYPIASTQDDADEHDPFWPWSLDSKSYVHWPYCSYVPGDIGQA